MAGSDREALAGFFQERCMIVSGTVLTSAATRHLAQVQHGRTDRPPRRSGPRASRSRPRAGTPGRGETPHMELSDAPGRYVLAAEQAAQMGGDRAFVKVPDAVGRGVREPAWWTCP